MNENVAAEILKKLEAVRSDLNESLRQVQQQCDEREFKRFRTEIGKIMGALFLDVVGPIYKEHPTLIPPGMPQPARLTKATYQSRLKKRPNDREVRRQRLPPLGEICILAGGLSRRMGRDKGRLKLGTRSMLGQIRKLATSTGLKVRLIRRDLIPRCGPLGGIYTGLKKSSAPQMLFLACDMPFVKRPLLKMLLGKRTGRGLFVQNQKGSAGFPFLLNRTALPTVEQQIAAGQFSIHSLAKKLNARLLRLPASFEPQLMNINTPEDWAEGKQLWTRK